MGIIIIILMWLVLKETKIWENIIRLSGQIFKKFLSKRTELLVIISRYNLTSEIKKKLHVIGMLVIAKQ